MTDKKRLGSCLRTVFLCAAAAIQALLSALSAQAQVCDGGWPHACDARSASCDAISGGCGCLHHHDRLTGDWWGARNHLADSGITFDTDATLFYMGVAAGGREREFRFAGHNDYVMNMDLGKLGIHEGLFLKVRGEHRYGESLAGATGAFLPSNLLADLPVADSEEIYLTDVLFTQMFSERVGVLFGKLDTLDGDANAFASGRGKTQFSNTAFIFNPVTLRTVPYSTLGVGFFIRGEGAEPLFVFNVLNATDTAKTSGFDELFADGALVSAEVRLPTTYFGRPGHQLFGGTWNSRDVASLGQDPRIVLPDVPIAQQSGSWSLYWNFDQYLYADRSDRSRGWGLFGRAGIGDAETNPLQWFLSFGAGGHSGRGNDTFGVGWYYSGTSNEIAPFLAAALGNLGDGQGVEMYYDFEVTPWCHITPDLQIIDPARESIDTALVAGLRARLTF